MPFKHINIITHVSIDLVDFFKIINTLDIDKLSSEFDQEF